MRDKKTGYYISIGILLALITSVTFAVTIPPNEPGYEEEMNKIERAKIQRAIDLSPVNHSQMERLITAVERIANALERK